MGAAHCAVIADGEVTVALDSTLAGTVKVFASAAGTDVGSVVREAVANLVNDWSTALDRLAQHDHDGHSLDAETVRAEFQAAVAARSTDLG